MDENSKPTVSVNLLTRLAAVVVLLVGLLLLGSSAVISPLYLGAKTVDAVVVGSPSNHAQVSFEVDGQTYTVTTTTNQPSWQIGQSVQVAYNPRNPAQASTIGGRLTTVVYFVVGVVIVVGSLLFVALGMVKQARRKKVIATGQTVQAVIDKVTRDFWVHYGARSLTRVHCTWVSAGGVPHHFTSAGQFVVNSAPLDRFTGRPVPVLIDPDNPAKGYWVDDSVLVASPG